MHLARPSDVAELAETDGNVVVPPENTDISLSDIDSFTRQLEDRTGFGKEVQLFRETEEGVLELDIEALVTLCWEHAQYSAAQGFSQSQLDVLRAIQTVDESRVLYNEIQNSYWTEPYSEQAIQKALRTLEDRKLVTKEGRGVYKYTGPETREWSPPE